jgi:hypothetical protein
LRTFLFWYGPLAFSLIAPITALLWRQRFPRMGWVFITLGAVCVVLSGFWIAFLHAWDATPDY